MSFSLPTNYRNRKTLNKPSTQIHLNRFKYYRDQRASCIGRTIDQERNSTSSVKNKGLDLRLMR
jgi:hypothetical protein